MINPNKPKVMLHIIMPNQISGPNNAAKLIYNSYLSEKYDFNFLTQEFHAGGKISIKLIKSLKKQIEFFNPDIIHLSGLQSAGFHAVVAARLAKKKKIIIAIRGSSTDALNLSFAKKIIFGWIIEPITLKLASHVYTVSRAMSDKKMIRRFSKNFIGTIHNSAPNIPKSIIKSSFRKQNNINTTQNLVAIVGRMIYDKGITYIIQAIKTDYLNNNFIFIFIGDGPLLPNLKKELNQEIKSRKVFLLGKQKNVFPILSECNIFLFATLHENLSNALLEACSCGLVPVVTDVGGNTEVVKDNYNGILISPKDSKSIVEALNYLNENPKIAFALSKNAKKVVETDFSQQALLEKIDALYAHLLSIN